MKVWTETKTGSDGDLYSVRYLLDDVELDGLQNVGLVGEVHQVIGMQDIAESIMAGIEKEIYMAYGGQEQ